MQEVILKTIPASEFKVHCLAFLKEVSQKQKTIVVTQYGKPIAKLVPIMNEIEQHSNPLKDSILFEKNIIDPIDVEWEADG